MKEQLIKYVDLLFAGAPQAEDIKQEILQNTLDRYDDLIAQGKSPEAAYSLAISGIGDINELLGSAAQQPPQTVQKAPEVQGSEKNTRLTKAAAIAFFILCPVPVLILEDVIGVCLLLAMVAAGVALLVLCGKNETQTDDEEKARSPLNKTLNGIAWGCGTCIYFLLSFATGAWYITWLIFPITACVCGLINACFELTTVFVSAFIRIILFGILTLVLIVSLLGVCLGVNTLSFIFDETTVGSGTLASSGTVSAADVRDIDIQWVSGSITIEPGDVQNIQFSETSGLEDEDKLVWSLSGDKLIIRFSKPQVSSIISFGSVSSPSKDLVITVPNDWICDELDIGSVSASIDVSQITAGEIDIVNVSGRCVFTGCSASGFSAETVSGKVEYTGTLNMLDFNTVSADCTADLTATPREIDFEGVSGNLTLTLPASCGYSVSMDSLSGDFTSDFSNGGYYHGDGSCEISADTVSGDIRIKQAN